MKHTKSRPNANDSGERATYLADLEIRRSVELQGSVEVAQNLGDGLKLHLQMASSSCLLRRNSKGTPDWMIAPWRGPSNVPALSTSSEADTNSPI